jgi:hypothetical protein
MNATTEPVSPVVIPPSAAPPIDLGRLLAIAVGLPLAIAAINYTLLGQQVLQSATNLGACFLFGWYVVQTGLISYLVGRGLEQPLLRWAVFGWILLLVDFLTMILAYGSPGWQVSGLMLPAALFAGQIGLCVVWAFLGDTRWPVRWPIMLLASAAVFWLWTQMRLLYGHETWTELLGYQVLTLAVLCSLLRLFGFRVRRPEPGVDATERRRLQFNIKHVLIWTTASAVLLGLAKALDLLTWQTAQQLVRGGLTWKLTVTSASAIVIVAALWISLGREYWPIRYSVGLTLVLTLGWIVSLWSVHQAAGGVGVRRWTSIRWELRQLYEIGWGWMGWFFLTGGFLAAALLVLRTLGYGLIRTKRSSSQS